LFDYENERDREGFMKTTVCTFQSSALATTAANQSASVPELDAWRNTQNMVA